MAVESYLSNDMKEAIIRDAESLCEHYRLDGPVCEAIQILAFRAANRGADRTNLSGPIKKWR